MCTGCIKCLGVLYDLDYSGTSQYEASRKMLIMIMKVLAKKRASPETVEAVITTSLLNKAAYQGVLSNWNLAQTLLLDDIYAKELRKRSKHMASHQGDNLFQPADQMGMGFTRLAYLIQERKYGLMVRAMRSDRYTRWAMEMMVARGAGMTSSRVADSIDSITPGLWITSLQEYGIRAGRILSKKPTIQSNPQGEISTTALLSSVLATTHEIRKLCQLEGIHHVGDLTECDRDGNRR